MQTRQIRSAGFLQCKIFCSIYLIKFLKSQRRNLCTFVDAVKYVLNTRLCNRKEFLGGVFMKEDVVTGSHQMKLLSIYQTL